MKGVDVQLRRWQPYKERSADREHGQRAEQQEGKPALQTVDPVIADRGNGGCQ